MLNDENSIKSIEFYRNEVYKQQQEKKRLQELMDEKLKKKKN